MRQTGWSALLALLLAAGAGAHRLDEYLQATLIGVTPDGVEVEMRLTPGVAILPLWMSVVDQDRDGKISPAEERAYVELVQREVELRVDGAPAPLSLVESSFPTLEAMREGSGSIAIRLLSPRRGHELRFDNRHLPQLSVYLVNCLTGPAGLVVGRPRRDEAQRSIAFEYSFAGNSGTAPLPQWPATGAWLPPAIGMLLMARLAALFYSTKRRGL